MNQRLGMHLLAGVLFAFGLAISGMTQPQKVIGFLDLANGWDPSLAFVMVGAIGNHAFATSSSDIKTTDGRDLSGTNQHRDQQRADH